MNIAAVNTVVFKLELVVKMVVKKVTCWGPASSGPRGYPQDERRRREREKTRETSLDRVKSGRERERKREREKRMTRR